MEIIKNKEYEGERPLFATHDLQLENVTIHAGESALKECSNVIAVNCRFEGKYPFWHNNGFIVKNCIFTEGARAALWYSQNLQMTDTVVEAPKMFREMDGIKLENVQIPNALETLWHCRNVVLRNVQATINGPIHSVKNPCTGSITAESYGEIIIDGNIKIPADCQLKLWDEVSCFSA